MMITLQKLAIAGSIPCRQVLAKCSRVPSAIRFYHAVTLEYTDASHIQHKATAVYTSGSDSPDENEDSDITSTAYYNDSLNYSLKLPQSFFVDNGYAKRNPEDDSILFGMKNAMGDASRDPTDGRCNGDITRGCDCRFAQRIRRKTGRKNYPFRSQLAEKDGLTYYLAYVSDVQYDPSNQGDCRWYKEMFTAAQNITADDFVLDDLTDKDRHRSPCAAADKSWCTLCGPAYGRTARSAVSGCREYG